MTVVVILIVFVYCEPPPCPEKDCPKQIEPVYGVRSNGDKKYFVNQCFFEAANCYNG